MLLYCGTCEFRGLKVAQSKVRTISGWDGISNHFWWHIYSARVVPKITGIGQLLLKLSLVVGWYPFWDTVQLSAVLHTHLYSPKTGSSKTWKIEKNSLTTKLTSRNGTANFADCCYLLDIYLVTNLSLRMATGSAIMSDVANTKHFMYSAAV